MNARILVEVLDRGQYVRLTYLPDSTIQPPYTDSEMLHALLPLFSPDRFTSEVRKFANEIDEQRKLAAKTPPAPVVNGSGMDPKPWK